MKKIIGIFLVITFTSGSNYAQENDYDYTSESIWGITKNSSSGLIGGFIFWLAIRPLVLWYFKLNKSNMILYATV